MLSLLRKTRRSLINSSGVQKYILYAFGEIALVVIGILIAIQINNWNSRRIDKGIGQSYLLNLKTNSEKESKLLDIFIHRASSYVQKVDSISAANQGNLSIPDLDNIGIGRQTYFLTNDTYQEIVSNGHLDLLPDVIKAALFDLNAFFKAANKIDEHEATNLNNQHLKMAEYFELRRLKLTSQYEVIPNSHTNQQQALLVYKNYINICYDWMKTQQFFYGELKKKHQRIIELIQEELD